MEDLKDKKFEIIQAVVRIYPDKEVPDILENSCFGEELLDFGFTEEELTKINNLKIGESYIYHIEEDLKSLCPNYFASPNKYSINKIKRVREFYVKL